MGYVIWQFAYRQSFNIKCTLVGNMIIDHLDVVGALPVGVAVDKLPIFVWRFMES